MKIFVIIFIIILVILILFSVSVYGLFKFIQNIIKTSTCKDNCNFQGECKNGQCECNGCFKGNSCEINRI